MTTKTQKPRWTSKDLLQIFGVSHMTLLHWRAGLTKSLGKIPHSKSAKTGRVVFDPDAVLKWAEKRGVSVDQAAVKAANKRAEKALLAG